MISRFDSRGRFARYKLHVTRRDELRLMEPLGSKPKFWTLLPDEEMPWLFKYARVGTGEDWAEKLASEIGMLLGLPTARVELAENDGRAGVLVESIVPHRRDVKRGQLLTLGELIHGNEILSGSIPGYDRQKQWGQAAHTYQNIVTSLQSAVPTSQRLEIKVALCGLLVLDAIIGNTDRHHENWALLRTMTEPPGIGLSPSYDHASSLGRELTDVKRGQWLRQRTVPDYVRRGHGAIFGQATGKHPDNPLELLRWVARNDAAAVQPWLVRCRAISEGHVIDLLDRVSDEAMSDVAKDFCRAFLCYTLNEIREL